MGAVHSSPFVFDFFAGRPGAGLDVVDTGFRLPRPPLALAPGGPPIFLWYSSRMSAAPSALLFVNDEVDAQAVGTHKWSAGSHVKSDSAS